MINLVSNVGSRAINATEESNVTEESSATGENKKVDKIFFVPNLPFVYWQ